MLNHFHVMDQVDAYLHDLLEPAEVQYLEEHCGKCAICEAALAEARKRRSAVQALPALEAPEQLIRATVAAVDEYDESTSRRRTLTVRAYLAAVAAAVLLLGGMHLYYFTLSPGSYELAVLGQHQLLAGAGGSLRVRVLDRTTGRGVAGVPVRIALHNGQGEAAELVRFTTDAQGTGQPRFQTPDWNTGEYRLQVIATPGWFGAAEELSERIALRRSWKVMLTSDKPVYQPGQVIRIRSLALRKPDLQPVAAQEAAFTIADPKGTLIFKRTDLTSKFGIAALDCPLAGEVIEGPYTIACKVGDTESKLLVEVKRYVLPKFKTAVTLDKPWYQPGQRVRGTVQADYFYGKPVADADLLLRAETIEGNARVLHDARARTDGLGRAEFDFLLPEGAGATGRIAVQATVSDSAGQKQVRVATAPVSAEVLRVEAIPEASGVVRGVANKVYVFASYPDGTPAAQAQVQVAQLTHELTTNDLGIAAFEITTTDSAVGLTVKVTDAQGNLGRKSLRLDSSGRTGDFLVRTDKAVYDGGDTVNLVALGDGSEPVFLDVLKDGQTILTEVVPMAQGKGATTFTLPAEIFGTIELVAYRWQAVAQPLRRSRVLYIRQASAVQIAAKMDRAEYRPGNRAKLTVALTTPDGQPVAGAVSLAAVDEAVYAVLGAPTGLETAFYGVDQRLLKPVLEVFPWSPDRGADQKDARIELEQALFARTARIETALDRNTALATTTYPAKVNAIKQARTHGLERVTRGWLIFGGTLGMVLLVHACIVYQPWSALDRALESMEVAQQERTGQGEASGGRTCLHVLVGMVCGIVLLLGAIQILGTTTNSTFGTVGASIGATVSGGGGDRLEFLNGATIVESKAEVPPNPLVVAKVPLPVAPVDDEPAQPLRVRDFFPETLLWRPQLITDEQGRASLDIDLADSITSWRLSASAVTADGRLGAASEAITVFQPFFVDLNLPVHLTRGDEVTIPAVVSSYLPTPQTVTLELKPADWYALAAGEEAVRTVEIKPSAKVAVPFTIKVRQVGAQQPLQLEARAGKVADAIKRVVEVVPDGRRVEQVVNTALLNEVTETLRVPVDAIEGSPRLVLKFYATPLATLVDGLDNIFRMPSGCFEQTSSSTYPNVLALDYLKRTGKSVPQVEARARQYIHLGYQRLLTFEARGGGFGWYPGSPADPALTAYGLHEFSDMARVHAVDPQLLQRTRSWLMKQQRPDGSWAAGRGLDDYTATAYTAWAAFDGQPRSSASTATRNYLLRVPPGRMEDPYVLALVSNALLAIDPNNSDADAYLRRLTARRRGTADSKQAWWERGTEGRTAFYGTGQAANVEATALAVLALTRANREPGIARAAVAWLGQQKDAHGTWHSTQATVLALKALLAGTGISAEDGQPRKISVTLGGNIPRQLTIAADQADVMHQIDLSALLQTGGNVLKITESTGNHTACQVAFRYHLPTPAAQDAGPLALALDYERTELAVGDALRVTARLTNRANVTAPMVLLTLPVPAGFAADTDALQRHVDAGAIDRFQLMGRGIVIYLRELPAGQPLELPYTLRATLPVQVTAAAGRAYEYYDPARQGRSEPVRLTVRRR